MKKEILLFITLVSSVSAFDIKFSKNFTKEINKDEVSSFIEIVSKKATQKESINSLNKIRKFLKTNEKVEIENQRQNSYPIYEYVKNSNKKILKEYNSNINFSISSKNKKNINYFIDKLLSLKNDTTTISFRSLEQSVSDELFQKEKEKLKFEVMLWARDYKQKLYKNTKEVCKLKELILENEQINTPILRANMKSQTFSNKKENINIEFPNEKGNISIKANFKYECEDER